MFSNVFEQGYYIYNISSFMSMKWWLLLVLSDDFLLVEHISSSPFEMCNVHVQPLLLYLIYNINIVSDYQVINSIFMKSDYFFVVGTP